MVTKWTPPLSTLTPGVGPELCSINFSQLCYYRKHEGHIKGNMLLYKETYKEFPVTHEIVLYNTFISGSRNAILKTR